VAGTLSSSERLVLAALAEGMRPREIAERLGKSEHTIRNQIVSAQQRLGVRTKEGAIAKALRFGLLDG
jgi:DNA-binding CsgD family transcriptional regulator